MSQISPEEQVDAETALCEDIIAHSGCAVKRPFITTNDIYVPRQTVALSGDVKWIFVQRSELIRVERERRDRALEMALQDGIPSTGFLPPGAWLFKKGAKADLCSKGTICTACRGSGKKQRRERFADSLAETIATLGPCDACEGTGRTAT